MSEVQRRPSDNGFEGIRQEDGAGREFWYARDLAPLLDYSVWRNFIGVVDKARQACRNSGHAVEDHFDDVVKMVEIGSDYAVFQDHGYKGLYGGLGAQDIHSLKGLKKSQKILDHMGSTELAANLFRATQTEDKLRRDGTQGKAAANRTPLEVGRKVRQTIEELGGTMPEALPSPDKSIKELEREQQRRVGKKAP